jgi:SAM-dependent methyltransferase
VHWVHAQAEKLPFDTSFFDVYTLCFTAHELTESATREFMQEALRVLRPGGVFALTDNDPRSAVLQKLPPVLFTLMKATEPWRCVQAHVMGNFRSIASHPLCMHMRTCVYVCMHGCTYTDFFRVPATSITRWTWSRNYAIPALSM